MYYKLKHKLDNNNYYICSYSNYYSHSFHELMGRDAKVIKCLLLLSVNKNKTILKYKFKDFIEKYIKDENIWKIEKSKIKFI